MPTSQENLNKFQEIWKMMSEGVSRQEFLDSFQNVLNLILKREKSLTDRQSQALSDLKALFSDLKAKTDEYTASELKQAINALQGKVEKTMKEEEGLMNMIRDKVKKIKEGHDG